MAWQPGRRAQGGGVKVGSFQEYVRHDCVVEDLSPSLLPVKEVRRRRYSDACGHVMIIRTVACVCGRDMHA